MADIVYPPGCRPLTEDLGTDELIRRLKTLANVFQAMRQDDGLHEQFIPLAFHLAEDYFLEHPSRDVQLLIACCIADVLRVYAPEAPYKDQDQIKAIFIFFIRQLYGLKDPKDPSFKRYFYLLENLAYVKSFNMCFEIEECHKIFSQLFGVFFKIINDEHSLKVKNFMMDILSPIITDGDNFNTELLDQLLINIVEPRKSQNKNGYQLAEQIVVKTSDSLQPIITMFFNQALVMDRMDKKYDICNKIYDLIYELNIICPNILNTVLPQLECKLKSTSVQERLSAVSLLSRMFSEANSELAERHPTLLHLLLGRFCDISVAIRVKCVQSTMHYLLNHPSLRKNLTDCLRARQHDSDENVRYEVVMSIVETAKRNCHIVCQSEDLLYIVRERTLDKKFKIRREAISGLAFIYKQVMCDHKGEMSETLRKSIGWIKNKVMHGYYMPTLEDRLTVERLLITCLVPYKLTAMERMKLLYHLMGTFDDNATKAFIELQKNQMKIRKTVSEWIKLHQSKDSSTKLQHQLNAKQAVICKLLSDPLKAAEYLTKFSVNMRKEPTLLRYMEIILKRDVTCKECADTMSLLIKRLGNPVMTNLYYQTVKMLVERVASVMVDKESISILVGLVDDCIQGVATTIEEVGVPASEAGERGLRLLTALSYIFSAHFFTDKTLRHMISLMSFNRNYTISYILNAFTHLGRYKPLASCHPEILDDLIAVCKDFALNGTPKEAKHAVRCIFVNSQVREGGMELVNGILHHQNNTPKVHPLFNAIVETLRNTLSSKYDHFQTKIVTLGHIAFNMPQAFAVPLKNMIARRIVKDLLIQGVPEDRDCLLPQDEWCEQEELTDDTQCKLVALKTMARWLLGLKTDEHAAQKTFRMLIAFVNQRGDLLEQNRLCPAEKSWLRLAAACSMLKICEQKGVGDQYTAEQFYHLSQLMVDPVPKVRGIFARKLHKGLGKGLPNRCLPLDFMGYYALAGRETDKKLLDQMRQNVETDVNKRRDYLRNVTASNSESITDAQILYILPDFMLAFAIPVLVNDPLFTDHEDPAQLKMVEKCLLFVLEPLMAKSDSFSYSFYKNLIDKMKNHYIVTPGGEGQETHEELDHNSNLKMWAACDLAHYIIYTKMGVNASEMAVNNSVFAVPIQLPSLYYKTVPPNTKGFPNTEIYLPEDTYQHHHSAAMAMPMTTLNMLHSNALKATTSSTAVTGKRSSNDVLISSTIHQQTHSTSMDISHDKEENGTPESKRTRSSSIVQLRIGKT